VSDNGVVIHLQPTLDRYTMLSAGRRIAVAVSGGADSICLLHLLHDLQLATRVVHVNHHLRGRESNDDAVFVAAIAAQLDLPCEIHDAPVRADGNLEQEARHLRLVFFRSVIERGLADRVALGHTRSDQAETVLFRFLRGAGTAGLAGIRPVTRDGIIRPLIDTDREEVRSYLKDRNLPWREDSTNASLDFARNRIRHELLPQLARDWNPAIVETLAHTADWAASEEDYWDGHLPTLSVRPDGSVLLRATLIATLPPAAARRLVRRAIDLAKGDLRSINFPHVESVRTLTTGPEGGRTQVPGLDICRSFDWIRLAPRVSPQSYCVPVTIPGCVPVPGTGSQLSLELIDKSETSDTGDSVYNSVMGNLDWCRLSGALELRNWQPGDRYHPVGASGEQKIADLFQNARVPAWERARWPILTDGSEIVWARQFGPSASRAASPESKLVLAVREVTA
jgi:tRNA(Ile)-lysidine synthase